LIAAAKLGIRTMIYRLHVILLAAMLALTPAASMASQNQLSSPTTGTVSGLQLSNNYNSALDSVNTCNSGASAPTNQLSSSASLGNCWWNTSTNALGYNDGSANWPNLGWFDTVNHYWMALTGGGAINNIASSGTTDLCSQKPTTVTVTGTTTITSFGSTCQVGQIKNVIVSGALTLTHNATSLILPNAGLNITTAAGDTLEAVYLGSGNWRVTNYTLANGQPLNTSAVAVGASSLTSSAQGFNAALNLRINASIASNALTVAIKGTNGSDPSAVNPVLIGFRDTTLANGDMIVDSLQSALSLTIASTNTMGASNGVPFRLWVFAFDNGGAVALALINCSNGVSVFNCAEDQLQNSQAGTSGGSSLGAFYASTSALSGKAVRILGYLEYSSGLTTAGTWNAAPTKIQLFGPSIKKPGDIIQTAYNTTTSSTTVNSTNIQTSLAVSIVPTSTVNLIRVNANFSANMTTSPTSTSFRLSRGAGPTYFGTALLYTMTGGTSVGTPGSLFGIDTPLTTSLTTYYVFGTTSSGSTTFNNTGGGLVVITADEIMGSLEPANDNSLLPTSMVG
jgi:hypothetical protein